MPSQALLGMMKTRTDDYGPIKRVRRDHKSPPIYLRRPPAMAQDDMQELLHEHALESTLESTEASVPHEDPPEVQMSASPRGASSKREASAAEPESRPATRSRREDEDPEDEILSVQAQECLLNGSISEALMAGFLQKRQQKEMPATGNDPETQKLLMLEWQTITGKQAVRVWTGKC